MIVIPRPFHASAVVVLVSVSACAAPERETAPSVQPPASVSFAIVSGNNQSAPVNTRLPVALRARVTTPTGVPVANFTLDFVVTSGGGSVFGGAEVTNSQGYAEEQWTLGPRLGPQTVEARTVNPATGVAASYGNFTATGTAPHIMGLAMVGAPTRLETVYADGSNAAVITTSVSDIEWPQLTPDHLRVVFFSRKQVNSPGSGDSDLVYQVNVNGTGLTVLSGIFVDISPHAASEYGPLNLAPDGHSYAIEYAGSSTGGYEVLFGGPCNCTLPSPPTNIPAGVYGTGYADTFQGAFSPDMLRAVFAVNGQTANSPQPALGIWSAPISGPGGSWTQLSTTGTNPSWSPDGQHIAFTGASGGTFVMDADGNNVKRVAATSGGVTWSPDGQLIGVGGSLMNLDGTSPVPLPPGFRFAWR